MKQFYFDTCTLFEPALIMAHLYLGPHRLMFGTDYPYVEADGTHVEPLPLPDDEKRAIIGANATREFSLD